jgi:hypothetical protein
LGTCWDEENDGKFFWEHWEHTTFSSWDMLKKERPEHLKRELSRWVFQHAQAHTPSLLFCSNVRIEVWKLHLELHLYDHLVLLLDNFGILLVLLWIISQW